MSAKPETTFIKSVHAHLPDSLYRLKMHNQYNAGAADVWYSGKKADMWVEYKFIPHIPDSQAIKISLSELQREWLDARSAEGRTVWVILGTKLGGVLLGPGNWSKTFNQQQLQGILQTRKALADWITLTTTGRHADTQTTPQRSKRYQRLI